MNDKAMYSRRSVLYGSAAAAGALALAACGGSGGSGNNGGGDGKNKGNGSGNTGGGSSAKGSSKTPLKAPSTLNESPQLASMVKAGKLPKLQDRLPENPYVIPHNWVQKGKYGGQISTVMAKSDAGEIKEFFYGSSMLRWLNDGMDIGPGIVETWDHNADASEWTLKFRKGLKWSDGVEFTTDDIMFWWVDMVINEDHPDVPPDEMKSGKGTVATLKQTDKNTLTITFDAPAPLTGDRLAMWTNGSIGNGPRWMAPKHYAKQFHPKYNPKVGKDWAVANGLFEKNVDFSKNPKCPTLNAWMLEKLKEGQEVRYVRNPYYHCVTKDGDQLPYIDTFVFRVFKETKTGKLQVFQGDVDHLMGQFYDTGAADIATIQDNSAKADISYTLWDGGSGTSAVFFLSQDYKDPKYQDLFRKKEFRQAISHAYNRAVVRKAVYYEQGTPTTGTLSPKAKEYLVNDQGKKVHTEWQDSYVKYDTAKANSLLDGLGLKKGSDGFRTFPDGSQLKISLDMPADTGDEYKEANNYMMGDLKKVGINAFVNPVPPDNYGKLWETGQLMMRTSWEVGDGPNHLVYPQWLVPIEFDRWAPLQGEWYTLIGTPDAKKNLNTKDPFKSKPPRVQPVKGGPVEALWKLYNQTKVEPDEMKRIQLVWQMIKVHVDNGPFFIGTVANTPRVVVNKKDLRNVPKKENLFLGGFANPWIHPTPAVYDPDTYYWEDPSKHQG